MRVHLAAVEQGEVEGKIVPLRPGAEHLRVRSSCGIFDVSHMGEIETDGPQAAAMLQRLLTNDVSKIEVGDAQYSCLCREDGGVLDDLFTYRLGEDRYLTVTNAANHERDLEWFEAHAIEFEAEVRDRIDSYAMLAVQGPEARGIVSRLAEGELPARFRTGELPIAGVPALVCGTGYTGEDGVELLIAPEGAKTVWDALVGAGASPAGLGARDTLRLEVNYCLYGNELTEERTPIAAAIAWCVKEDTGFIGSEACHRVRAEGPEEIAVAICAEIVAVRRGRNAGFLKDRPGPIHERHAPARPAP